MSIMWEKNRAMLVAYNATFTSTIYKCLTVLGRDVRTHGVSRDSDSLLRPMADRWVITKFSKIWGSARSPSAHWSSAVTAMINHVSISFPTQLKYMKKGRTRVDNVRLIQMRKLT